MASVLSDDIGYVKLILLLVKGGTFLVKKHILRLTKQNKIDVHLKNNKRYITKGMQKQFICEKHMDILFPGQSEPTNLECWDISLYSYILLNLFGAQLLGEEKSAIKALRDKRNELLHSASTTLTEGQFLREWTRLTMTLFQLRRELSKAEQDEYDDVVDKISTINDFNVATNELKLFEESDESVHIFMEKLKSLEHKMENMMKRIKALEDKMEIHQEMKVKMDVSASTPEIKETAETELLNAAKSCDSSKEDTNVENDQPVPKVMSAYNDLVSDMEGHGVNITKVEKGSILITVRCPTVLTLKNAIQYFEDRKHEERLRELEKVLSETVENPIDLNMSIVLETVQLALEQMEKDNENKSVLLTLQCRGYEGVRNALEFFGNGASTNALNSLSEALSESVGEPIELHSTIDIQQLTKDITQLEQQIVDSNPFTEPAQTPCGEPALNITPPDCQTLTETPSDVSTFTEIPSNVLTLGEAPSKHPTPCENLTDEPKHIITRGKQELTELPPVDSTFKTRQKKSTVKHEISTAFACPTDECNEHHVDLFHTRCTKQRLVEAHLLSECLELNIRRATLHEIESCCSADIFHILGFHRLDRTHTLQYNELPCGCIKVVQMTDTPSIKYIPVNYVAAAGCMVDMAYRVGTGELKNGLVVLPPTGYLSVVFNWYPYVPVSSFAIAAKQMKEQLHMKRVLIFHLGTCANTYTQQATYDDREILFISLHNEDRLYTFNYKGAADECGCGNAKGFNININFENHSLLDWEKQNDSKFLVAFRHVVMPIAREFSPEIVFVSTSLICEQRAVPYADIGHMITELMSLADGKIVVGHECSGDPDLAIHSLQALLGKHSRPIIEEELQEHSILDLKLLAHVMKIQLKYWSCLHDHLSAVHNLIDEAHKRLIAEQPSSTDEYSLTCIRDIHAYRKYDVSDSLLHPGKSPIQKTFVKSRLLQTDIWIQREGEFYSDKTTNLPSSEINVENKAKTGTMVHKDDDYHQELQALFMDEGSSTSSGVTSMDDYKITRDMQQLELEDETCSSDEKNKTDRTGKVIEMLGCYDA